MPPTKRQKTMNDSGIFLESDNDTSDAESQRPHKSDKTATNSLTKQGRTPGPYEYICFHRPLFDVDGSNWREWSDGKAERMEQEELFFDVYQPGFEKESKAGIFKASPAEHKDHKWIIMWDAWLKKDLLTRKAKYCDPDAFGLNMATDWKGWGMQEIVETTLVEFDQGFQKKTEQRLDEMWVIISALGLWLNENDHIMALIANEDGDTTCELIGLVGCALLAVLGAIDRAGALKPDARYLDLPLVIGYYLELSHDLPAYGIERQCVSWRKQAVAFFKKGGLDAQKALFCTEVRLEKLGNSPNDEGDTGPSVELAPADANKENEGPNHKSDETTKNDEKETPGKKRKRAAKPKASENDPWGWNAKFKAYKKRQGSRLGGQRYDITKMSRKDRAAAAYDGKDPLARFSLKDLREDCIDF
ncbi:hypothetical protein BKA66DRAFT_439397 [Pyrenochaeta sp. MPI-SDFR-AT-0127]|nr:hypothetical protein BKA66DRAFT_439397 [Pyrenochaeta sp. MPI-SDFR-AT-0127]